VKGLTTTGKSGTRTLAHSRMRSRLWNRPRLRRRHADLSAHSKRRRVAISQMSWIGGGRKGKSSAFARICPRLPGWGGAPEGGSTKSQVPSTREISNLKAECRAAEILMTKEIPNLRFRSPETGAARFCPVLPGFLSGGAEAGEALPHQFPKKTPKTRIQTMHSLKAELQTQGNARTAVTHRRYRCDMVRNKTIKCVFWQGAGCLHLFRNGLR
jgi:hypothetical protein